MVASVSVGSDGLRRAWRRSDRGDLWLRFTASGEPDGLERAVLDAMSAGDRAAEAATGARELSPASEGPSRLALGPPTYVLSLVHLETDADLDTWVAAFAAHLEASGVSGTVGPHTRKRSRLWDQVEQIPWPQLSAYIAYVVVDPRPSDWAALGWNVSEEATARILAEVAAAAPDHATTFFNGGLVQLEASPEVAASAVARQLQRDPATYVAHVTPDAAQVDWTGYWMNGLASRHLYAPDETWDRRVDKLIRSLVATASLVEQAFVQYSPLRDLGWDNLGHSQAPPPPVPGYTFRYHPCLLQTVVPDARGALVVRDAHLERAHDLTRWNVQPIQDGRHLLTAHDLEPWFASPDVDPDLLDQARRDFGDMIVKPEDIEAT